ncbi:uncharacterized protein LOC125487502 [Rhincodon typus]|uniref:uncharacterized protein LOC125487502 n=1 Tax=Rhincodon typus TaxID=259920 RepID=UPI0020306CF1|nr:uncharacterized protein LOC125487502 [Rhincodon typus]
MRSPIPVWKDVRASNRSGPGLVLEFHSLLENFAHQHSQGHLVLLIDSADCIQTRNNQRTSDWIPETVPRRVTLVLSVTEDSPLHQALAKRKGMVPVHLGPLEPLDRSEIVRRYLAIFGKKLEESAFNNQVSDQIRALPPTLCGLIQHALGCLEREQGQDMVTVALGALHVSTKGLRERDLYCVLCTSRGLPTGSASPSWEEVMQGAVKPRRPVPMATFARLMRSLRSILGIWTPPAEMPASRLRLSGDLLREAVWQRYLRDARRERQLRQLLAVQLWRLMDPEGNGLFANCDPEVLPDLPQHLILCGQLSRLASLLTNLHFCHLHLRLGLLAQLNVTFNLYHATAARDAESEGSLQDVDPYRCFVAANWPVLGAEPTLFWQQALNQPEASPVHRQARSQLLAGDGPARKLPEGFRLVEWTNRPQAFGSQGKVMTTPTVPLCAGLSPSGRLAVVGTSEGYLHVLDLESGEVSAHDTHWPEHGPTFQAQRLQLKGKKGPASPQQLLKVPRQSSAGTVPGPPVRRVQSGSLCYGDSAEEEGVEDSMARAGGQEGSCSEPGLPLSAVESGAELAGQCKAVEPRQQATVVDVPSPSRQQTSRILCRLRQERLCNMVAAAQKEEQEEDKDRPPASPLPGGERGTSVEPGGLPAGLGDRLPFRLRVRPWDVHERSAGDVPSGTDEDRRAGPQWATLRPEAGNATASRASQTYHRTPPPPTEASQRPGLPSPPPLLPRLEAGRLVSLLVTTGGPSANSNASLARLQPISATRLATNPSWAPGGSSPGHGPPLSMTILALSNLRSQESQERSRPPGGGTGEAGKEPPQDSEKPRPDPETLRKLQESLLHEDSEEDEGDLCRICLIPGGTPLNPLLEPCKCVGSLQFVHHDCLKKWLQAKIISGADLAAVTTCELCKQSLKLDFDNFDVHEFHRKRAASQVEEQMTSSSLYMAVLLHLYEQRFTELMRLLSGSATTYQFTTAEAQPGADGSDVQNSDSEEEDSTDLRSRGAIVPDGMLLTFEQRDA